MPVRSPRQALLPLQFNEELAMPESATDHISTDFVVTHPLDAEDTAITAAMRAMVSSTKGDADAKHPLASPLHSHLAGMPPVRIHVGYDEVLLDDSIYRSCSCRRRRCPARRVAGHAARVSRKHRKT
jgi:acetyl esterase/lipase